MKTRRIGATDLRVSQIGFGCGGNAGLMVRGTAAEQELVIGRALDCGISYFDNAPDYGDGLSEENLGRALQVLKGRPIITTKVEVRAENLNDIADHVVRSIEGSLRRLRLNAVDIVQIHNGPVATPPDLKGRDYKTLWIEDYWRDDGALDGIRRLLDSGKARYAGVVSRGNDATELSALLKSGLLHLVNVPFTLLNPTAGHPKPAKLNVDKDYGNIIGIAQAAGVGTAIFSPLAGGILTDGVLTGSGSHPLARPKDPSTAKAERELLVARRFRDLAAEHGLSIVHLAYRFILSHSGVSTVLGGFSSVQQVEDTVRAVGEAELLSEEMHQQIHRLWNGQPDNAARNGA
ncbi:MAG TPA: aldo/keto reductase [Pseudolabrys sp.]|nr:aldo/keto reductase [Pseudolabrys sp.]